MKEFTTTLLRTESTKVYNEVFKNGQAKIVHRDRPAMILIDEEKLKSLINFAKTKGYVAQ